jgi:hypothetical protein
MSEIPTEETLLKFDALLDRMGLRVGGNSPINQEADIVHDYYRDRKILGIEEAVKKWNPRYDEFYSSRLTLERVVAAATALEGVPRLRTLLGEVLEGSLAQDFQPSPSKLYFPQFASVIAARQLG